MQEINLGALTTAVQKAEKINKSSVTLHVKKKNNEEDKTDNNYSSCRIQLSEENKARIDLLRFSDDIEFESRTQIVNMIIARYFEEHSQNISLSIKSLMKKL